MPSERELEAWRAVLTIRGAKSAVWFNMVLNDVMELRYGIGVECEPQCTPEEFEAIRENLVGAWIGIWPVNTPFFVHHLTDDDESSAIRGGVPIFL